MLITDNIRKNEKRRILQNLSENFFTSQYMISGDGRTTIAIDERRKLLCLINENNQYNFFKANQILDYGIIIKDEKYMKQSFWSSAIGYVAGRIIDSNGGLQFLGSHLSRTKFQEDIQSIQFVLKLSDFQYPFFPILIYKRGIFSSLNLAKKTATHWEGIIMALKNKSRR